MDLEEQYERLLRYCFGKVKNREQAEDITQEAFLKLWQTTKYKSIDKEIPYLYTIARNLCLDHFKKKKEELLGDDSVLENATDDSVNIEETSVNRAIVEQAMQCLSPEDREIVLLCYVSGLSVTDTGKVLGMSRFAVHRRLKAAKTILKRELEGSV
ncbi:MAG: RNA polymerase sigma factor [Lachnospiraceae bacterium]|nr:RNA polymerase sigma factor [Lachnospiraceae bacterium]